MFNNPDFLKDYTGADATMEILIMLLVAFILGALLGWILWGGRIRKLVSEIAGLNTQITDLNGRVAELDASLTTEKDNSRKLKLDLDSCSNRRRQLEVENVTLESKIRSLELELKAEQEKAANLTAGGGAAVVLGAAVAPVQKKKKEDLKMIEGVGPAIEKLLHAADIKSFAELADASQDQLKEILDAAGERFRIHNPETWPQQAALLRDGKMEEFEKLTSELKGGRIVDSEE